MEVPFLDLKRSNSPYFAELQASAARVIEGGWYIAGSALSSFERDFARFCAVAGVVGVGNGLDALELLLRAHGIGHGDAVVVPANTYIATWLAVTNVGATVVPVDPDPMTMNITAESVSRALRPGVKAVMAVHLYGLLAPMEELRSICRNAGVLLLEDAAQAHGARRAGMVAGSCADGAAFSFYPTKNLGALGDAGAVASDNPETLDRVRVLRNYGSREKYVHESVGRNSRMDELQAAFLTVKLPKLDSANAARSRIAQAYARLLTDTKGVVLPVGGEPEGSHVWHVYNVRVKNREAVQARLRERGVGTLVFYPQPPHLSEAYRGLGYQRGDFPVTEVLADTVLALPAAPYLSDPELEWVGRQLQASVDE